MTKTNNPKFPSIPGSVSRARDTTAQETGTHPTEAFMTSSTPKPMSKAEAIAEFEDIKSAFTKERAHMAELCTSMARYILDGGILTTALSDALEDLRIAAVNVGDDADEEGS